MALKFYYWKYLTVSKKIQTMNLLPEKLPRTVIFVFVTAGSSSHFIFSQEGSFTYTKVDFQKPRAPALNLLLRDLHDDRFFLLEVFASDARTLTSKLVGFVGSLTFYPTFLGWAKLMSF